MTESRISEIINIVYNDGTQETDEGSPQRLKVVRGKKKITIFKCPDGQKFVSSGSGPGKCVKMSGTEKIAKSRAAKKAAKKRKGKGAASARKRAQSMKLK